METKTLGAFIRQWRKQAGRSQEDVAREIGVSQATFSEWERDDSRPGGDRFIGLAEAIGEDPRGLSAMPGRPKASKADTDTEIPPAGDLAVRTA